jgi:hypothetical protein
MRATVCSVILCLALTNLPNALSMDQPSVAETQQILRNYFGQFDHIEFRCVLEERQSKNNEPFPAEWDCRRTSRVWRDSSRFKELTYEQRVRHFRGQKRVEETNYERILLPDRSFIIHYEPKGKVQAPIATAFEKKWRHDAKHLISQPSQGSFLSGEISFLKLSIMDTLAAGTVSSEHSKLGPQKVATLSCNSQYGNLEIVLDTEKKVPLRILLTQNKDTIVGKGIRIGEITNARGDPMIGTRAEAIAEKIERIEGRHFVTAFRQTASEIYGGTKESRMNREFRVKCDNIQPNKKFTNEFSPNYPIPNGTRVQNVAEPAIVYEWKDGYAHKSIDKEALKILDRSTFAEPQLWKWASYGLAFFFLTAGALLSLLLYRWHRKTQP